MKRSLAISALFILFLLVAILVAAVIQQSSRPVSAFAQQSPASTWVWQTSHSVLQINNGCCFDQVVVVEGQVGNLTNPSWNEYDFSDGSGTITLDFEDQIPSSAIPQNVTVRIIGQVDDQNLIIDVYGLQTLGTVAVTANATAAGINAGNFDNQDVILEGQIGNLDTTTPGIWWNWFDFTDATDTTTVDLENDLTEGQVPQNRTLFVFGEGDDYFGQVFKINVDYMLVADDGSPTPTPTASATNTATATATQTGPTPTPTPTVTDVPPTATPDPSLDKLVYLPSVLKQNVDPPPPTATPTPPPPNLWVWDTTNTVAQLLAACCDDQVVVVEGQIGTLTDPVWMEYNFSDGSGTITLDFEDEIPTAAIPQNTLVRIIGDVEEDQNRSLRKIDVYGLQTLGTLPVSPNRTVAEINTGSFADQEVAVKGQFGNQDTSYPFWNVFDFSEGGATTKADLENDLTSAQIPRNRTLLLYGKASDLFGTPKINARLMLFAANIQ